jgi:hypothetical protein
MFKVSLLPGVKRGGVQRAQKLVNKAFTLVSIAVFFVSRKASIPALLFIEIQVILQKARAKSALICDIGLEVAVETAVNSSARRTQSV